MLINIIFFYRILIIKTNVDVKKTFYFYISEIFFTSFEFKKIEIFRFNKKFGKIRTEIILTNNIVSFYI